MPKYWGKQTNCRSEHLFVGVDYFLFCLQACRLTHGKVVESTTVVHTPCDPPPLLLFYKQGRGYQPIADKTKLYAVVATQTSYCDCDTGQLLYSCTQCTTALLAVGTSCTVTVAARSNCLLKKESPDRNQMKLSVE